MVLGDTLFVAGGGVALGKALKLLLSGAERGR